MNVEEFSGKVVKFTADELEAMIIEREGDDDLQDDERAKALGEIIFEQLDRPDVRSVTLVKETDVEKAQRELSDALKGDLEKGVHKWHPLDRGMGKPVVEEKE
jgi:hypothetical protein